MHASLLTKHLVTSPLPLASASPALSPSLSTRSEVAAGNRDSYFPSEPVRRLSLHDELLSTAWLSPSLRSRSSGASDVSMGQQTSRTIGYLTPPESRVENYDVPWKQPLSRSSSDFVDTATSVLKEGNRRFSETCLRAYEGWLASGQFKSLGSKTIIKRRAISTVNTPAISKLRRLSVVSDSGIEIKPTSIMKRPGNNKVSKRRNSEGCYLITDVLETPAELLIHDITLPQRSFSRGMSRRVSVTEHGLLPPSALPPDQAITNQSVIHCSSRLCVIVTEVIDTQEERRYSISSRSSSHKRVSWKDAGGYNTPVSISDTDAQGHTETTNNVPLLTALSRIHSWFGLNPAPSQSKAVVENSNDKQTHTYNSESNSMLHWSWHDTDRYTVSGLTTPDNGTRSPQPPAPPRNTPNRASTPVPMLLPEVQSFPPLLERTQTSSNQILPLQDVDRPHCLYDVGIDARTGPTKNIMPVLRVESDVWESSHVPAQETEDPSVYHMFRKPNFGSNSLETSRIPPFSASRSRADDGMGMGASDRSSSGANYGSSATAANLSFVPDIIKRPEAVFRTDAAHMPSPAFGKSSVLLRRDSAIPRGLYLAYDGNDIRGYDGIPGTDANTHTVPLQLALSIQSPIKDRRASAEMMMRFLNEHTARLDEGQAIGTAKARNESIVQPKHRVSLINDIAPLLAEIDRVGIYGMMTGTGINLDARARLSSIAVESNREPYHNSDSPTRDRLMSVDWIG